MFLGCLCMFCVFFVCFCDNKEFSINNNAATLSWIVISTIETVPPYTRAVTVIIRLNQTNYIMTLKWPHNERDVVSNYARLDCLLGSNFKENIKAPRHWPLWGETTCGRYRWPVDSPHKGPVTRKVYPFDDVNMNIQVPKMWEVEVPWTLTSCFVVSSK